MEAEHHCHADGCEAYDAHPELPFCKFHLNLLPEPHRKALWSERRRDGLCTACNPKLDAEPGKQASERWQDLFHLALAIILTLEHDDCGAPDWMHDPDGFCWGCGIANEQKNLETAAKVIAKFRLGKVF